MDDERLECCWRRPIDGCWTTDGSKRAHEGVRIPAQAVKLRQLTLDR